MTLIDKVLKQIEQDVANQDFTALEVLLEHTPDHILEGFLSECTGAECGFCEAGGIGEFKEYGNPSY